MTREERKIGLYCLKAYSDYHSEVCEECIKYPNCDHTIQDDVIETIIKALEQEPCEDAISREQAIRATYGFERYTGIDEAPYEYTENILRDLPPVTPQYTDAEIQKMQEMEQAEIQKTYELGKEDKIKVLDKIRAEVVSLTYCWCEVNPNSVKEDVLEIIDKYKESEGKMLVCPACGLEVHSDYKTCPRCGAKMESEGKKSY